MSKVKVKRKSTLIDMTAMSDVTVLLLTFFMLTATFTQKEPVKVKPPASVSEIKIPETNILQIFVEKNGKLFLGMDNPNDREALLRAIGHKQNIQLTQDEVTSFRTLNAFGVPFNKLKSFLALADSDKDRFMANPNNADAGIPMDSVNNQFKSWVYELRQIKGAEQPGEPTKLTIAIKASAETPYPIIKKVMSSLQDIDENRYNLITELKTIEKD